MKRQRKWIAMALAVTVTATGIPVAGLAANGRAGGDTDYIDQFKGEEWFDQNGVFEVNRADAHTSFIGFDNVERVKNYVLRKDKEASPYYQSLNGMWKFQLADSPVDRNTEFFQEGYDVSGYSWMMRTAGLFVGMLLCMAVFYKNQKHRLHKREFKDLFHEFDPRSLRNRWYIKLTLCVSTVLLIASLLGIPRAMWAGIACMSVCLPFQKDLVKRAHIRWIYNILGCMIFLVIYAVLPKELHPMIGLLGGIGVGYSAGYPWQTVFNTFGALSIASGLFGAAGAVILRIATNAGAAFYTALMGSLIDRASDRLFCRE